MGFAGIAKERIKNEKNTDVGFMPGDVPPREGVCLHIPERIFRFEQ